jgi:hypothetical protein
MAQLQYAYMTAPLINHAQAATGTKFTLCDIACLGVKTNLTISTYSGIQYALIIPIL